MIIVLIIAIGGYIGVQGSSFMIENIYIEGMQHQDYASAFRAIDAQQFTINGRRTTQTQFIREAQAIDAREGKITSVRKDNASTNIRQNERIIIFSRGQKSYPVRLVLKISNENSINPLVETYPYRIVSVSRL